MSLQERLDRIKAGFEAQAPAEVLEVMHRATRDLRASWISDRAIGEGQPAPGSSLESSAGGEVSLAGLRDPGNEVAATYGLRWALPDDLRTLYLGWEDDLEAANGDPSWTLPMPARYIIDPDGTVRYARFDPDYTRRPEPAETLEALRAL